MRIAVLSCIHNDVENLLKYLDILSASKIDVLACPGDFTDGSLPRGFNYADIADLIVEELRSLGKPVVVVPGSWDKEVIKIFEKEDVSVHGRGKIIDGVGFYGFGGAKTPFGLPLEPSEIEITKGLERAYKEVGKAKIKVQLTHAPPTGTSLDMIASGAHVGSVSVRKFIEKKQPQAAICSHIHESRGVDMVRNTKVINPGRFPEGHFGVIDLEGDKVVAKVMSLI